MVFEVKTTGVCEAKPNLITFNLVFTHKDEKYDKVVDGIAKDIVEFHKIMKDYAKPEDFKTLKYSVERKTKRVEVPTKRGIEYRYDFSHFEATQIVKWEMACNKIHLFEILQMISNIGEDGPTVKFVFGLTDDAIAELENQCTEKALILAKEKAEAVRKTLGMSVSRFVKTSIVESFESYRTLDSNTYYDAAPKFLACQSDIEGLAESMEPEDVRVEINVVSEFDIA